MTFHRHPTVVVAALLLAGVLSLAPRQAFARTRLENICTVYGQQEVRLVGIGLVTGLNGTGDGGGNLPAIRALAATLKLMNTPVLGTDELKKNASNVAMVLISATVPKTGLRRGQRLDCYVSSPFGAKSLHGGRLLIAPVETSDVNDDTAVGLVAGPVYVEDETAPTSGKVPGGVVLEEDFVSQFVDVGRGGVISLLLDAEHSSFTAASEIAEKINQDFTFEAGKELAHAVGPGVVEVTIPDQYRNATVEFIAGLLDVRIENPHTQARVVVNPKSEVVIVTGEVDISPVVISQKNLTVEVGNSGLATSRFVPLNEEDSQQSPLKLQQLVDALNRLRVPTSEIIVIIRELHRSGKLHADYVEY